MSELSRDDIDRMAEGRTVAGSFLETVAVNGSRAALRWMDADGAWDTLTFDELAEKVAVATGGLRSLGVGPGDRVVLMMRNLPDFHWCDLAVLFLDATPVSIYNSSGPEQVEYLVGHCGAKVAVVENEGFLSKLLAVRDQLPALETIVVLVAPDELPEGVVRGDVITEAAPLDLTIEVTTGKPEDLATIIYTSGTTGNPKGVMISNHNLVWTFEAMLPRLGWSRGEMAGKRVVSYLPMAHIAERIVSHYLMIAGGVEVTTCPDPSLLAVHLAGTTPNLVFAVPRVWEKVYAGITALTAGDPDNAEKFEAAVEKAVPLREKVTWGTATAAEQARLEQLDAENFASVRALLGLDALEIAGTGAAPIPATLVEWFRAIGILLADGYGLSESTGVMTFERFKVKAGFAGRAVPGIEVTIAGDGEVLCRGGNVFEGYLNDPEKTAEALDEDGWLHTGDIGEIDEEGYLRIIDRKKELIITAGGQNISPANLEAALMTHPLIGQAAAIGDQRPFVTALVVLDAEVAPVWAARNGIEFTDLEEFARLPEVIDAIDLGVVEAMAPFNNAEKVKKVCILTEEWLPDSDLLTPTSKLKRRGIHARYSAEIETLYT
jgi:long-chain acyl-CoA synthetase